MCSAGWLEPGSRLFAVDEAFQAENAEYDAAKAAAAEDTCRVYEATTPDGAAVPTLVLGSDELSEAGQAALGEIVAAAAKWSAENNPHGGVIQELMLASMRSRMVLREAGEGDLADRLAAAVRAARDVLKEAGK